MPHSTSDTAMIWIRSYATFGEPRGKVISASLTWLLEPWAMNTTESKQSTSQEHRDINIPVGTSEIHEGAIMIWWRGPYEFGINSVHCLELHGEYGLRMTCVQI